MRLCEYEAKNILATHNIPIPEGKVVTSPEGARAVAEASVSQRRLKPRYWLPAGVRLVGLNLR